MSLDVTSTVNAFSKRYAVWVTDSILSSATFRTPTDWNQNCIWTYLFRIPKPQIPVCAFAPISNGGSSLQSNDAEGAMESQYHSLFERPSVSWRVWFPVEDPVWRKWGDLNVVLRIGGGRHRI